MLAGKLLSQTLVWLAAALLPLQAVPSVCACSTPRADAVAADSGGCCSHQQTEGTCGGCESSRRCDSSRDCECCGTSCLCVGHDQPTPDPLPTHAPHGHHSFAAPAAVATASVPLTPAISREMTFDGAFFAPSSLERCVALSRLAL
jgi:hypothetical protein